MDGGANELKKPNEKKGKNELYTTELLGGEYVWVYNYSFSAKTAQEVVDYWAGQPNHRKYLGVFKKLSLKAEASKHFSLPKGLWYWASNQSKGFNTLEEMYDYWNSNQK